MNHPPKSILIDGYNLLFASGLTGKGRGVNWLQRARARLITLLRKRISPQLLVETTVVYDAENRRLSERDDDPDQEVQGAGQGPRIVFAHDHDEADDLLEILIRQHSHPKTLWVVSSDHRIQAKAKAKKAIPIDADVFLDLLEAPVAKSGLLGETRVHHSEAELEGETTTLAADDVEYWMREFDQS